VTYEKCLFANKSDKVIEKKRFHGMLAELEVFKKQYKCDWYIVSAKTNENLTESMKIFMNNVYNKNIKDSTNVYGEEEAFEINDIDLTCTQQMINCGGRPVCGGNRGMFACGRRPDD